MKSLGLVAWGLVLVFVDFRLNDLDLVPDPVGWALTLVGLVRVSGLHPAFGVAMIASGVAGMASIPDLFAPYDGGPLSIVSTALHTVVVFSICTALMTLVPDRRELANTLRWVDLGLAVVATGFGLVVTDPGPDASLAVVVVLLVVVALVVYVVFLVLLFQVSRLEEPPAASAPVG